MKKKDPQVSPGKPRKTDNSASTILPVTIPVTGQMLSSEDISRTIKLHLEETLAPLESAQYVVTLVILKLLL